MGQKSNFCLKISIFMKELIWIFALKILQKSNYFVSKLRYFLDKKLILAPVCATYEK